MNLRFEQPFEDTPRAREPIRGELTGDIITAEQFSIDDVDVQSGSVKPLADFPVTVDYSSDVDIALSSLDVDTDHPDYCDPNSFSFYPGAELFVRVSSAVEDTFGPGCYNSEDTSTLQAILDAAAPSEPGQMEVLVELVGQNSLEVYDEETITIQVDDDADEVDEAPDDGGDGNGDGDDIWDITLPGGDDVGLPEIPSTGIIALVLMLVLLLVIAVLS